MFKVASIAVAAITLAIPAAHAAPAPKAKLSMGQARAIALKVAPGKVIDAEYEKEAGTWRYSFDIRQGRRIHEIGVNANTGKIVEDKYEGLKDKDYRAARPECCLPGIAVPSSIREPRPRMTALLSSTSVEVRLECPHDHSL